ncbi:hypothetical protein [Helicobacter winghamensis]|uniref:Uncharacterized protein n=1 Tax=Helicobacter winghamensis TaxID=157268 RepID=A0A2N3PK70_9HELI|nr:hypothetical protein [Helicobacter winghamensis]PKT77586.1 hypothetical protein BCM32_05175 [Helicobacter winghamensis]PKT81825.1 hypothetical protein BCM31_01170 [Helicobacter winghamensis]PKT82003.1 hypothetical protein BCM33_00435 [Helicobacter winghamensis]QOQ98600.1 hypothetical protein A0Z60_03240 [Helicobacter winghamensis]
MNGELQGMSLAESLAKKGIEQEQTQEQNARQVSEAEDNVYPLSKEELEKSKDSIYYAEGLIDIFSQELQNED